MIFQHRGTTTTDRHDSHRRQNDDNAVSYMTWILPVSATGAALLAYSWYKTLQRQKSQLPFSDIPYHLPNPHWLYGHLNLLATIVQGQHTIAVAHAGGKPRVSTLWIFSRPTFTTVDAALMNRIMKSCSTRIGSNHQYKHFTKLFGNYTILLQNGALWRSSRALAHRVFNKTSVGELQKAITEASRRVGQTLQHEIDCCSCAVVYDDHSTKTTTPPSLLQMDGVLVARLASLHVFGLAGLGHDFGCTANGRFHESEIFAQTVFLQTELTRRCFHERWNVFAQLYWLPCPSNWKHYQTRRKLKQKMREIFVERGLQQEERQQGTQTLGQSTTKFVESLISGFRVVHDMDQDVLSDWMVTILFGGYDTSSLTLAYTFYLLSKYPYIQESCAEEAQRVLDGEVLNSEDFSPEVHLPYTWACVFEALRLFPPATITTRSLEKPFVFELDGKSVTLPAHSRILASTYWINHSEENFPRPEEFLPERWCQRRRRIKLPTANSSVWEQRTIDNDVGGEIPCGNHQFNMAFSSGGRNCVGQALALRMVPTILAMILRDVKMDLQDPDYEIQLIRYGANAAPKGGIPMTFTRRSIENRAANNGLG